MSSRSPRVFGLVLLLFAALRSVAAPVEPAQLVGRTAAERMVLLSDFYLHDLFADDSAAVFQVIRSVREAAERAGDDDLLLEAALMRAHYFYYHKEYPGSVVVPMLDSLIALAEASKADWLRVRSESLLGHYHFSHLRNYEDGFTHLARAVDLLRDMDARTFPLKQICLYHIALAHYRFRDHRSALDHLRQAVQAGAVQGLPDHSTTLLNTMGLCYRALGIADSSDHYFRQALASAERLNERAWIGITTGNLGHNHYGRGEFAQAIPLLEKDAAVAREVGDDGLAAGALTALGDIRMQQGDREGARALLNEAYERALSSEQYDRLEPLFPLLAKLHALDGHADIAARYIDSALFVRDSLDRAFSAMKLTRAEQKVQAARMRAEAEALELRLAGEVVRRNGIIAALFLAMVIALLLFNRQRARSKARQRDLEAAQRITEAELRTASADLQAFMRSFQEKSALLEEAEHEVARLKESVPAQEPVDRDVHLKLLRKSVLLTDQDWQEFSALFEKVHAGFFARLAEKMPGLTPAETRFMALGRLGMNSKEMAAMLGVGAEAIRQVRMRVRRKAGAGDGVDLEVLAGEV